MTEPLIYPRVQCENVWPPLQRSRGTQYFHVAVSLLGNRSYGKGRPSKIVYLVQPLILRDDGGIRNNARELRSDRGRRCGPVDLTHPWGPSGPHARVHPSIGRHSVHHRRCHHQCLRHRLFSNGVISFAPVTVGLLALLYDYVVWTHTAFAITDRRSSGRSMGCSTFDSAALAMTISNVTFIRPYQRGSLASATSCSPPPGRPAGSTPTARRCDSTRRER